MGIPMAYKRVRRSLSPESFDSTGMLQYPKETAGGMETTQEPRRDCQWAPLAEHGKGRGENVEGHPAGAPGSAAAAKPSPLPLLTFLSLSSGHSIQPVMEALSPSPMETLPSHLLVKILQLSQPTAWDLCRMSCVARAWRTACAHRSFWTRLRVGSGSLRAGVEQLAPRCTGLSELFVDDPHCELHVLQPIVVACAESLRRVVLDCDGGEGGSRTEAGISSVLWLISLHCKNLESIELQSNGHTVPMGSLEGRTMWFLTSAFRHIRYFASLSPFSLSKQGVYLMAIAWRDLECVRLSLEGLGWEDLLALRKCHNLRAMELVGGSLHNVCESMLYHLSVNTTTEGLQQGVVSRGYSAAAATLDSPSSSAWQEEECGSSVTGEQARCGIGARGRDEVSFSLSRDSWRTVESEATSGVLDSTSDRMLPRPHVSGPRLPGGDCLGVPGVSYSPLFHPSLELLVLNRVDFDAESMAVLAMACPNLKRILVSGSLCDSCLASEGPCASSDPECVRKKVDLIQEMLSLLKLGHLAH